AYELSARVVEIDVVVSLLGERPEAEHPVLGVQDHVALTGYVVRQQGGQTEAEVHVLAVAQEERGPTRHEIGRQASQVGTRLDVDRAPEAATEGPDFLGRERV